MDADLWVAQARRFFASGTTRELAFRDGRLQALSEQLEAREGALLEALRLDLGKPAPEAYLSELGFVLNDIRHARRNLARWARPRRVRLPAGLWPARGEVVPQPCGLALIVGPWNYPFSLVCSPLVSALAAGACVCLKPSEYAPHTARELARLVASCFPPEHVTVAEGGPEVVQAMLRAHVDRVFFTGSAAVGRRVLAAAAETLTPVTLELGGRSPCLVSDDADLACAARRIVRGKFMNAGQTCVAPDHVWVPEARLGAMVDALAEAIRRGYGPDPRQSPAYGRIVNARHLQRLVGFLSDGTVACGGTWDAADLYLAPTVLTDVKPAAPVLGEEVFGPILPVLPYRDLEELFAAWRAEPEPLALYAFTSRRDLRRRLLRETRSGGVCFNDTVSQILGRRLPFGGVGASGMGSSHGEAGFAAFCHPRSVLTRACRPDPRAAYPPAPHSLAAARRISRWLLDG